MNQKKRNQKRKKMSEFLEKYGELTVGEAIELNNLESEKEEFRLEVESLYDKYLYATEKRGISYGELAYIQDLNEKELNELYNELLNNKLN